MKRLRHPIRAIREPFGKAGLTVAILALVMAMVGGAFAANHPATASKAGKQGKQGKPGKTGPAGPAGPAGAPGAKGDAGAAGSNGTNGTNGNNGVSVTTSAATVGECPSGGIKVASASPPAKVCNGTTGFTETLPEGKTETGAYYVSSATGTGAHFGTKEWVAITFNIPLEAELDENHVIHVQEGGTDTTCTGSPASPTAPPGFLCVYETSGENFTFSQISRPSLTGFGAGTTGAILQYEPTAEEAWAAGTWAVTAPE